MEKVCIIGKQQPRYIRERMKNMLEQAGYPADLLDMPTRNVNDWAEEIKDYTALISAGEKIGADALVKLPKLKLISRFGVGTNEIDKVCASNLGIAVCNAAGSFSQCVAECAMALTLNLIRNFTDCERDLRKGDWSRFFEGRNARQLCGKTVGLIGFGGISQAFAKMLNGFDCNIIAYDKYWNGEAAERLKVQRAELYDLAKRSDVVSLHIPLSKETENFVDEKFIKTMKDGAILINTSRGGLVDESAVVDALESGKLSGFGTDVFAVEPPPADARILKVKNTMLLPHSGSNGIESVEYAGEYAARNVIDFFNGREVKTILNKDYTDNGRK